MIYSLASQLNLANNTFADNQIEDGKLVELKRYEKVSITANMFENNDISGSMFDCPNSSIENTSINIDGNTMWKNRISGTIINTVEDKTFSCSNNTIVSNDVEEVIYSNSSQVDLYNNQKCIVYVSKFHVQTVKKAAKWSLSTRIIYHC